MTLQELLALPRAKAEPCNRLRAALPGPYYAPSAPPARPTGLRWCAEHATPTLTRVTITPHSTHPPAVAATVATLEALHGAGFKADPGLTDGQITGTTQNAGFLKFAAVQQGYVSKVTIDYSADRAL